MTDINTHMYEMLYALQVELGTAETAEHVADICLREDRLLKQQAFHDDKAHVYAWHNHLYDGAMRAIEDVLYPAGFAVTMEWEQWYDYAASGEWC